MKVSLLSTVSLPGNSFDVFQVQGERLSAIETLKRGEIFLRLSNDDLQKITELSSCRERIYQPPELIEIDSSSRLASGRLFGGIFFTRGVIIAGSGMY